MALCLATASRNCHLDRSVPFRTRKGTRSGETLCFMYTCHPERSWFLRFAKEPTKSKDPENLVAAPGAIKEFLQHAVLWQNTVTVSALIMQYRGPSLRGMLAFREHPTSLRMTI